MIIWITGRSGSGKTTLAKRLRDLSWDTRESCIILDGDNVRKWFPVMYSNYHRRKHLERITAMANLLSEQVDLVIIACISPNRQERDYFQRRLRGKMVEVYLAGGEMWPGTVYEEPIEVSL